MPFGSKPALNIGWLHSTEVAFALLTQLPRVRIPALLLSSWTVEIEN